MERVRKYLDGDTSTLDDVSRTTIVLTPSGEERINDDEETKSFLSSARIDGRSSDTKSIGSLSQHLFESDDNEDEKYYGTCNGYSSHPGSKSNLLLCNECDLRSRTCNYRPQTPSHYGRFVEERIDREIIETKSTRNQQHDRRASTISSLLKSPMKIDGSPRYWRDEAHERSGRSKSIPTSSPTFLTAPRPHDQERSFSGERRDQDSRSPSRNYRSPVLSGGNSPRYQDVDQRAWNRRTDQEEETEEGKTKKPQERHHDSRNPVQICDRSPSRYYEKDQCVWKRQDQEEEASEDQDYLEESEESPPCPLCNGSNGSNGLSRCAHCNFSSDQDEGDLICFHCQMSAEEETTSVEGSICPKCENNYATRYGTNGSCQTTSSSSEGTKYHVDAVVKIHVNNRSIDVDSDDTIDSDLSNNRDSGEAGTGSIDRLETIVEAKNDTASDNGEDNGSKINGQPRTKYLNYMIVLFL